MQLKIFGTLVRFHSFLPSFIVVILITLEDDNAKPIAAKYLKKWRPGFEERLKSDVEETKSNGMIISA